MTVTDWLISIAASSAGGAALLALAGYLGRSQLAHWLNKDLEAAKAQHQRELESYKVSLIAASERAKAESEIKKVMAIRIVEKKFAAIDALHRGLSAKASLVISVFAVFHDKNAQLRSDKSIELVNEIHKVFGDLSLADTFLDPRDSKSIYDFISKMATVMGEFGNPDFKMSDDYFKSLHESLHQMQSSCNAIVRGHLQEMMGMDVSD